MGERARHKNPHPVCPEHWDKLRSEALQALPFWTRPFASGTVRKLLNKKGFVESATECAFCRTNSKVDKVS